MTLTRGFVSNITFESIDHHDNVDDDDDDDDSLKPYVNPTVPL